MSPDEGQIVVDDAKPSGLKRRLVVLAAILGVMLLEGVGVFVIMRMTGEPAAGHAGEVAVDPAELLAKMDAEVSLGTCDAVNKKSGQSLVIHIVVSARVAADKLNHVTRLIERRESTIKDRIQMILRSADPQHLNEPNLDTLKRQLKFAMEDILGDEELILEVLIPQILQTRSRL
jgi:flagellar basal body-associated protein FliL